LITDTNPKILEKQAEMLRNASFEKRLDIFLNLNLEFTLKRHY